MLFYFLMKSAKLCTMDIDPLKIDVSYLKELISKEISVNEENVILIANGGVCIQDGILGTYNCADNKDNPVFVYLRDQKRIAFEITDDNEINKEFNKYKDGLKITLNKSANSIIVLQENESLSFSILESSKRIYDKVVLEIRNQFLLFEGWSAALANLYDSLHSIEKRIDTMKSILDKFYYNGLEDGFKIMEKFVLSKAELENVPLLSSLFDDSETQTPANLLQWVLSQDSRTRPQVTVKSLIFDGHQAYYELLGITDDEEIDIDQLKEQWGRRGLIATALKHIEVGRALIDQGKPTQSIVEEDIEELERVTEKDTHTSTKDFLRRLDFLSGAREQCEKLVNLLQTHKDYMEHTVRQCRDSGGHIVLSDHCANARRHLDNVKGQYIQLKEYLSQVERSKQEFTNNIDIRKIWLQKFQTKICEVDDSLFLVKEKIKRVRTGLRVLDQIHNAPSFYARGLVEIARRQQYLDFWYSWGVQCSKFGMELRQRDKEKRMLLEHDLENHFIQSLFRSLYSFSLPKLGAPILQSSPPILPTVTETDLNELADHLPHLRSILSIDKVSIDDLMAKSQYPEQLIEDNEPIKSIPMSIRSCDLLNGVSLPTIPVDQNLNIEDLSLSQVDQNVIDGPISNSTSNYSSKMVKSIDSMDFQLTNDAATETKKDIICVSRSIFESLVVNIHNLKSNMNNMKQQLKQDIVDHSASFDQALQIVTKVKEICISDQQIDVASSKTKKCNTKLTKIVTSDAKNSSNCFQISHKEFTQGDPVVFFGYMVNGIIQYRMITTDNRVYFLNDNNFSTPPTVRRQRRESVNEQRVSESPATDCSVMGSSQIALKPLQMTNGMPLTMPIIKGTYVSKEEYVCKKTTNRYGLPIYTKFYRVQANINWESGQPQ